MDVRTASKVDFGMMVMNFEFLSGGYKTAKKMEEIHGRLRVRSIHACIRIYLRRRSLNAHTQSSTLIPQRFRGQTNLTDMRTSLTISNTRAERKPTNKPLAK